ncbi:SDR family oxidoreductase [Occultella glacieicola]|uniref:SDR family oxidoreductase n=1 Tax=Occultella glacieicola TaxID=2518684 RepID=A0ABY2E4Q7_9MICO|nr:SDR family oxidoreductase [Occultella glacieicola]TDE95015.1 SDR family oxidoreductase [Occultella glacieicola]
MTTSLFDLSGRLAFVTGSARGIGNALALGLAQAGADVVVHGRDAAATAEAAERIAAETGVRTHTVSFDVTDPDVVRTQVAGLIEEVGVPDILVNNAGMQHRAPFNSFPVDKWDQVLATNLSSVFYVSQPITTAMAERGSGKVINIGSAMSALARQTIAPYTASKGGVVMLTKGMAADLARFDIQVNAISPGYFASEMNRDLWSDPEFDGWLKNRTPANRWGRLEELVGAAVFLSSDASSFVSGQNIHVDGGLTSVV